ncbi:MAG TPA: S8 family serine peptidase, partial [Candidatus Thermoplasmatota archaeon]|nr:S8 family serine peptidase [Candidatus Thermoplasmatota archaeon]
MPARWLLALLACLALLALGSAQAGSTDLVVGLAADAPMPQPGQTWHGMPVLKSIPPLHAIVVDAEKAPLGALPRLDGLPEVRYVAPDIREHLLPVLGAADPASGTATPAPAPLLVPGDALYGQQYGPAQVRAPAAWDTVTGNRTTAVCVVDTGVRHTHEDLQDAWRGGYDFVDDDADPWDGHSHGTHVAGIAAAGLHNGVGIAGMGNVALYGVRVLNDSGAGSYFDVAAGIVWCADEVPEPTVINLSLGGSSPHQTLQDAVEYAVGKGAIVVAAAGNSGPCTDCVGYPARYEQAIAVACTNSSESRCSFSSRGASVDIAAPGHQILSSIHSADDAYTKYSGTSMSTPHVAGALALAWQHLPALTNEQLRERLEATAQDIGYAGKDKDFGHGELDLLCLIQDNRTCSTAVLPVAPPDYDTFTACQDATDRYGYACSVHNRTYVPLGPGATPIELSNNVSAAIPIGFPFRFYDKTYDSVYISANGWVSFEPTVDPRRGPATIMPLDLELFHWAGGEVRYGLQGEAPHRTFRVEWHDILALVYDSPRYTFQIVLHEDGSVAEIEYDTIERPMYRRYDAYITDASEAFRLTFQSGAWAAKDLAVRFTHPGDGHPAKPEGVTATTPAAPRQVHVSWAAPTQGPWPTGYRVFQQDAAGKTTLLATLGNVTSTTVAVRDDVQARVRVAAFNGVGEGPMSAVATARSHAAPSVVRELSVDPDAQGGIRLSWLPPASSGGLPLQGYRVYAGFKPDFLWQLGTTTATSYQTPYSVGGPFYFSVAAYSGVDEGPPASLVCVVPAHVAVAPDCELLQPLDGRSCESQGQDLYGYTCHTRAYRYEDLASATATRLPDGREPVRVQLGFPFTFYGKTHTEAYVSPQGVLYFDRPFDAWSLRIPDAAPANNMVLVGGTLDHQREGSVHHATLGVAPARRFVVEWRDVSVGWDSSTAHVQLILHEATNEVEVQFGRMPWQAAFTVGIESPSGSTASIFAEQRTIQGMSGVRFVPPTNPLQASFLPPGASDC